MRTLRIATTLLATLTCAACGGGGGYGSDQNNSPSNPTTPTNPTGPAPLAANFKSIQDNVFTPICTACHVGAAAPRGLQLDEANSYALLVGVASSEVPGIQRVKAGDPNNSYIIQKLEGTATVGGRMPLGGTPLSAATIQVIRQWITDGAQKTAAADRAFAQSINNTAAEGSLLEVTPGRLIVGFNKDLDASLVNEVTLSLQRIVGQDAVEDVPMHAALNPSNASVIFISPRSTLAPGQYKLTVWGLSGGVALADVAGRPLGRDYQFEFSVEAQ